MPWSLSGTMRPCQVCSPCASSSCRSAGSKDPSRPDQSAVDFDAIYRDGIKPAIEDAGLAPVRADEEQTLGVIHKPMFERLLLCDFAIAEITIPNANVFYELGVRHASRHNTTLPIFAGHAVLPFGA